MSILNKPYFQDEQAAFAHLESIIWPDGPTCPHCDAVDRINKLKGVKDKKGRKRIGLWKCYHCRKQFTVRVGTLFERSHIPLHKWFQAVFLMCSSKKGISSHQLHRTLEVTYKTAWFMSHRIREAMAMPQDEPLGGKGKIVEVDETYITPLKPSKKQMRDKKYNMPHPHRIVLSLVERGGKTRSFQVKRANMDSVIPVMLQHIDRQSTIYTDESPIYHNVRYHFGAHGKVNHYKRQYVNGEINTQSIEGFFSIFKRGFRGIYQHCAEKHLHRYLAEFDFRYSYRKIEDQERTDLAMQGISGKRLTYRSVN